jgi:hypothetical protein
MGNERVRDNYPCYSPFLVPHSNSYSILKEELDGEQYGKDTTDRYWYCPFLFIGTVTYGLEPGESQEREKEKGK